MRPAFFVAAAGLWLCANPCQGSSATRAMNTLKSLSANRRLLSRLTRRQYLNLSLENKQQLPQRAPEPEPPQTSASATDCNDATETAIKHVSPFPSPASPSLTRTPVLPRSIRVLYAACFLFVLSGSMVSLAPAQALIRWMTEQGEGPERATTLLSLVSTGSALLEVTTSAAVGAFLDQYGRKPALLALVASCTLTYVGSATWPGVPTVCLAKLVGNMSIGFFGLITQTIISDLVGQATADTISVADNGGISSTRSGLVSSAVGVQMALTGLAFLFGVLCAGQLTEKSLFVVYGVASIIGVSAMALIQFWLPETLPELSSTTRLTNSSARKTKRSLWKSLVSCTRLLTQHGPNVRVLGILLMLMSFPGWMGDTFQVFTKSKWDLSAKQFSLYLATYAGLGIFSNTIGGVLVRRIGVRQFTCLALVCRIISQSGVIFFGFRGSLIAMIVGFLGQAQTIGVIAALVSEASKTGLPQGELSGERASLAALLKVVGPVLYSTLYVQGQNLFGTKIVPFIFNVGLFVIALVVSATRL